MEQNNKNTKTRAWQLYELGVSYNNQLTPNQYNTVQTNTEFFAGNQWYNLPTTPAMKGLPKPVFNILKRVASLFISSICSTGTTIHFEPLAYYDGGRVEDPDKDASTFANAMVDSLLEKFKFDYRIRDALFDGAVTGDYCSHFYYDPDARPYGGAYGGYKGEIQMELIDGINVMFGNPNCKDVQKQPYIIIVGRDTVEHLKAEKEYFRKNKEAFGKGGKTGEKTEDIIPDWDNSRMPGIGGKVEIQADDEVGKALYVYLYTKKEEEVDDVDPHTGETIMEDVLDKDGVPEMDEETNEVKRKAVKKKVTTVHVTKATRTAVIYEDIDTGMSYYPIAWGNWEKQKNQYHGRSLITGLIPNQIFINSMFATAMRHLQLSAFQKTMYNADLISSWSNEVGQAIAVHGLQPGQSINTVAQNMPVAEMSAQIFQLIDKVMAYTKECLGATDAQMGSARAENTSALMVLSTNSEVPLENIRANLNEWVEDVGMILLDMMGTYYGRRPVIVDKEFDELVTGQDGKPMIDPMTGMMKTQTFVRKTMQEFDFSVFKNLFLNLRVDVGATSYYSEIAMTQTLDNLRKDGTLDVIQYLERIPDKLIPKKQELIDELKGKIAQGLQPNADAGAAIPEPGTPVSAEQNMSPQTLNSDLAVQGLPNASEANFDQLPNIAKKTALTMGNMRANR